MDPEVQIRLLDTTPAAFTAKGIARIGVESTFELESLGNVIPEGPPTFLQITQIERGAHCECASCNLTSNLHRGIPLCIWTTRCSTHLRWGFRVTGKSSRGIIWQASLVT